MTATASRSVVCGCDGKHLAQVFCRMGRCTSGATFAVTLVGPVCTRHLAMALRFVLPVEPTVDEVVGEDVVTVARHAGWERVACPWRAS